MEPDKLSFGMRMKREIQKTQIDCPGNTARRKVRVTVDKPERRRRKAVLEEIIEAHPERIGPACPHFSLCGGCVWQHWQYAGQLQEKRIT